MMQMDRIDAAFEPWKFRGRGNRSRGNFNGRGDRGMKMYSTFGRENFRDKPMNGILPMRRGMGRMHPYMDPRGGRGIRGRPPGLMPPIPPREMGLPFPPPPPPPPPPLPPLRRGHPPPPPGLMGFRGMPPPPRGRGMMPAPHPRGSFPPGRGSFPPGRGSFPPGRGSFPPGRGSFPPGRGFPNGRGAAAHPPPPGRGQRWPAPPGGRRF